MMPVQCLRKVPYTTFSEAARGKGRGSAARRGKTGSLYGDLLHSEDDLRTGSRDRLLPGALLRGSTLRPVKDCGK